MPLPLALVALLFVAGCVSMTGDRDVMPARAPDFTPAEIRQTTLLIRLSLTTLADRRRQSVAADYEGALLDALNERAVIVKDARVLADHERPPDTAAALAQARGLDADALIVVDVLLTSRRIAVCEDTRPRRIEIPLLAQKVEVLRTRDGATRLRIVDGLEAPMVEVDCDTGRARRRTVEEVVGTAAEKVVQGLLGP